MCSVVKCSVVLVIVQVVYCSLAAGYCSGASVVAVGQLTVSSVSRPLNKRLVVIMVWYCIVWLGVVVITVLWYGIV